MSAQLIDARGKVVIDGPRTPEDSALCGQGATHVIYDKADSRRVGVYVDDEAGAASPDVPGQRQERDKIARKMVEMQAGLVVVGIRPDEPHHKIQGTVCALEWYPWAYQFDTYPFPKVEAYILQWDYTTPHGRKANVTARRLLLWRARARRPKVLWLY